jgi:hypothetical protein
MYNKDDQKGKLISFSVGSGLAGLADSSEVFPVYIGDDRTDEDAFKVRISCFLFLIHEILYVQIFPYKLQISCSMFLDSCNRKLLKLCVCVCLSPGVERLETWLWHSGYIRAQRDKGIIFFARST